MIQNQIRVAQSIIAHFPDLVEDPDSIQHLWRKLLNESIVDELRKTCGNKAHVEILLKSLGISQTYIKYYLDRY